MQKNRLQDCPEAIGSLSKLKQLELDGEYRTAVRIGHTTGSHIGKILQARRTAPKILSVDEQLVDAVGVKRIGVPF